MRTKLLTIALLAGAACSQGEDGAAPWLTAPDAVTHVRYFPLDGTLHDGIDCNSCHGAFSTFRQFDCVTCHDGRSPTPDAIHLGNVAEYTSPPQSAACLRCHPTGTSIMADHGRFFPIGTGTSHVLGCSQCHGSPRADLAQQKCNTCHVAADATLASKHGSSAIGSNYGATSPLACLRCHADGTVTSIASHPSFRGERLPHEGARCFTCHPDLRTDLVASPNTPYAADFSNNPEATANLAARKGCYAAGCHTSAPPD